MQNKQQKKLKSTTATTIHQYGKDIQSDLIHNALPHRHRTLNIYIELTRVVYYKFISSI